MSKKIDFGSTRSLANDRRRQMAMLLKREAVAPMGPTETIGGVAISRSPLEGFSKLLAAKQASTEIDLADTEDQQIEADKAQAMADIIRRGTSEQDPQKAASVFLEHPETMGYGF